MRKYKSPQDFKMPALVVNILKRYKRGWEEEFIFPFLDNSCDYSDPKYLDSQIGDKTASYNKGLKDLAFKAKIKKKITTHTARHSWADAAR